MSQPNPPTAGRVMVRSEGRVTRLRLNRPDKRNALDRATLDSLCQHLRGIGTGAERAVLIEAEGPVFCAGLDLAERQAMSSPPTGASPVEPLLDAITDCPLPVVAAVQGDAIAGGCELALACDFVIAADTARFRMPLVHIGLSATWHLTHRLLDITGLALTRELLLRGRPLEARQLASLGVISEAPPAAQVGARALALAEELAQGAPLSMAGMKAMINRSLAFRETIPHDDVDRAADLARASWDAREGVNARLEKRPPAFEGR